MFCTVGLSHKALIKIFIQNIICSFCFAKKNQKRRPENDYIPFSG